MADSLTPAIVIGASGAIGRALADALDEENPDAPCLRFARSFGGKGHIDISDEASIEAAAKHAAAQNSRFRLIVVATGLLHEGERGPEKAIAQLDGDWLAHTMGINTIGPMLVAKHFLPLMADSGVIRFAALSARVGSISDNRLGGWYGYRMGKAALNMGIRNLAIEWRRQNERSIIIGLHPGTVDTALSQPFQANVPEGKLFNADRAGLQLLDVLEELKPGDSGKLYAWDGEEIAP